MKIFIVPVNVWIEVEAEDQMDAIRKGGEKFEVIIQDKPQLDDFSIGYPTPKDEP
jgi:hypothetical protein